MPFGFASFYPTAALLRAQTYGVVGRLAPVMAGAFLVLSIAVWNRGVRNYESTGS